MSIGSFNIYLKNPFSLEIVLKVKSLDRCIYGFRSFRYRWSLLLDQDIFAGADNVRC